MITSPTFGSAMERMLRCQRMWAEGERYEMLREGCGANKRWNRGLRVGRMHPSA
jgi:hypothetical protein